MLTKVFLTFTLEIISRISEIVKHFTNYVSHKFLIVTYSFVKKRESFFNTLAIIFASQLRKTVELKAIMLTRFTANNTKTRHNGYGFFLHYFLKSFFLFASCWLPDCVPTVFNSLSTFLTSLGFPSLFTLLWHCWLLFSNVFLFPLFLSFTRLYGLLLTKFFLLIHVSLLFAMCYANLCDILCTSLFASSFESNKVIVFLLQHLLRHQLNSLVVPQGISSKIKVDNFIMKIYSFYERFI